MTFHTKFQRGAKPLRFRYDRIDGFIKIHNKFRYLVLFDDCCDKICNKIKYLISKTNCITYSINHNFGIDSSDSLHIEKILTSHNFIIPIKSVVNKYKDNYHYNILLEKDRIDVSEGIDVNKTSASEECDICHYWYFLNYSFKFQPNVCNIYHDALMMFMNLSDIAILNIKGFDYRCIISLISKKEAINLMQNENINNLSSYIKMSK